MKRTATTTRRHTMGDGFRESPKLGTDWTALGRGSTVGELRAAIFHSDYCTQLPRRGDDDERGFYTVLAGMHPKACDAMRHTVQYSYDMPTDLKLTGRDLNLDDLHRIANCTVALDPYLSKIPGTPDFERAAK